MKRDMDLLRQILIVVRDHEDPSKPIELNIEGYTEDQIGYHVYLLSDAGLIATFSGATLSDMGSWIPQAATWHGHEFLDAVQNAGVWAKVKQTVKDKGGSIPFAVLQDLAVSTAKAYFLGPKAGE